VEYRLFEHLVQRHTNVRNRPRREPRLQQVGLPTGDALRLQRSRRQLADRVGDPLDALAVRTQRRGPHAMAGDHIEPPRRQLGHCRFAMERR